MNEIVPLYKLPSRKQAQEIIRTLAERGDLSFHPHCQLRKRQRKISSVQIVNCLKNGYVAEDPYQSPHHKGWETAVRGSAAGTHLKIAVCLRWSQDMLIIAAYEI